MKNKKVYKVDLKNGDTLVNMFDYLCSKVDWKKSFLDSEAIVCMNTLFIELGKDTRIIKPWANEKEKVYTYSLEDLDISRFFL